MGKIDELLDIVNENGKIVGKEKRSVLHQSPDKIHRTVNILISNSNNEVLVQKRSKEKKFGPGIMEISAGGHVKSGQTVEEAAKEELFEELGIRVSLRLIAKELYLFPNEKELAHLFLGYSNGPFKIDRDEIEKITFVPYDELGDFLKVNKEKSMLEYWLPTILEEIRK